MYIDSLNWNILNLLQQNARISNAAIGRKVGISSPAVSERIKKMEDAGLILGYKVNKSLGTFIEGKYNKYWNREWYDFKFGVNYVIF